jgi:hypothetical protein
MEDSRHIRFLPADVSPYQIVAFTDRDANTITTYTCEYDGTLATLRMEQRMISKQTTLLQDFSPR